MPRMFLELIPRYSTEVICCGFPGSLDWDYEVRFSVPTVDLASGGELVHLRGSGDSSGSGLVTVQEYTLGEGFGRARGERSDADEIFFRLINDYASTPAIYTDGSKINDGENAGAPVWVFFPEFGAAHLVHGSLSIFAIESIAILNAINIVEESGCTRALIVSDSRSALQAISSPDLRGGKHRVIYEILRRLQEVTNNGLIVALMWVPSHINLYGNDVADYFSRQAAEAASSLEDRLRDISTYFVNDILNDLTKEYETFSLKEIYEEAQFKGFRYFNKEKSRGDWFRNYPRLLRHLITLVNRVRSFHTRCNAHLNDKGIVESPACECGAQIQDIEHIFLHCPMNKEESVRLVTKIYSSELPDSEYEIAFDDMPCGYWALADFITRTKKSF